VYKYAGMVGVRIYWGGGSLVQNIEYCACTHKIRGVWLLALGLDVQYCITIVSN
jgi:hypothetical protein